MTISLWMMLVFAIAVLGQLLIVTFNQDFLRNKTSGQSHWQLMQKLRKEKPLTGSILLALFFLMYLSGIGSALTVLK